MREKKKILLSILGILLLVLATIGVTFAVFTYTKLGTTENTVTTGTLKFLYTENTGVGNGINIENAFPVSDEVGKGYNTDKYVFDFSVEATNSGTEEIPYEVTLRKKDTSTLPESNVKVYLTDMTEDADTAIVSPTLYSDLTQTTIDVEDEVEKTIYNGTVLGGELDYLKDFRLRMWIDEASNQDDINGKTFTALVNVYSNVPLVSEEELNLRNSTEISSISMDGIIAETFDNGKYDYELEISSEVEEITLDIETLNPNATVEIEKLDSLAYNGSNIEMLSISKTFSLTEGNNYFKITITSENKQTTNEYVLLVTRGLSGFAKKILDNNHIIEATPTLTTSSNRTNDASGLYMSTDTNSGKPTYYFRGNVENNYVDFASFTWRIVRINEDGTIRLVMQDGINNNTKYVFNSNYNNKNYMYYTYNSNAKSQLESWFTTNITGKSYSNNVAAGEYYCEQAKVAYSSRYASGSGANMAVYGSYKPNFKCENDANGYGIVNSNIGLLSYDDVIHAGGYYYKDNISYYLYNNTDWWTMSPLGFDSSASVWSGSSSGSMMDYYNVSNPARYLRAVLNLKPNVTVTGTGIYDDPYKIQ